VTAALAAKRAETVTGSAKYIDEQRRIEKIFEAIEHVV
jgi:hypothetical protein